MKLVWLCNMIPTAVSRSMGIGGTGGLWVDHVLDELRGDASIALRLYCPGPKTAGSLDAHTGYVLFPEDAPHVYLPRLENQFARELADFQPDVIHIWGTEWGHTLAMVNAAKGCGLLDRVVISIQGLCSIYARHFAEGLPEWVCRRYSLRDAMKHDNIRRQQREYAIRGAMEQEALGQVRHVIGRTDWDRAITGQLNPNRTYHFCNETMRPAFYQDTWQYAACTKHRIFTSSCAYPVKGFHYLLEALEIVLSRYPDTTVSVPGRGFFANGVGKLRQDYYHRYLGNVASAFGARDKIHFLGSLDARQMKQAFLEANVFVLPSTIENSPNSLGEAMLLGVPCVAADVGGVTNLMHPGEGFLYPSTAPYMLAEYIMQVFAQQEQAEQMGARAQAHARQTHDPEKNRRELLRIYESVAGGGN